MKPKMLEIEVYSKALQRRKKVNVLLPEERGSYKERCPVLFLLHGYGGNRHTWLKNTSLIEYIESRSLIVVLPESGRRWFINDIEGYRYEDYLVDELVPFIDTQFLSIADRQGRAIGGFSMGGAAAVFQGFRHPDLFSVVFSQSGAFEAPFRTEDPYAAFRGDPKLLMPTVEAHEQVWGIPGSFVRQDYNPHRMVQECRGELELALYLDVGTEDYPRMVQMNRNFHQVLLNQGIKHDYFEGRGGHDWSYADSALLRSLNFLADKLNVVGLPVM